MKNKKYKILVLSDLKDATNSVLLNTMSLAKMIDAEVDFFYVKKPIEIVDKENQLSAKRTINRDHFDTDKKIKQLLEPFSIDYNQKIKANFSFGNVKEEILKQVDKVKPDVIVLGKRKSSPFKLIGDNITDFLLKNYKGSLFIAADNNQVSPNKTISAGVLNAIDASATLANEILEHSKKPLKTFKIGSETPTIENRLGNKDVIEYVFEKNDSSINNLSNYLNKNDINLLCVNRGLNDNKKANKTNYKDVIKKLDVSLLLSN